MTKITSNYKVGDIIIHKPSKTVYCIHEIATWTKRGDAMCNTLCTTLGAGMTGGQFYADDTNLCLVSEFFSQNVVIPRGENRHIVMYADIDEKYAVFSDGRLLDKLMGRFVNLVEHSHGYNRVYLDCKDTYLHRLVAEYFCEGKTDERNQVNHIDGNKKNNDYTNLEWVTNQENTIHAEHLGIGRRGKRHRNNVTGYVGVSYNKKTYKYQAQISLNGTKQYLGVFKTAEEAALKYNEASMLMYGDAPNEVIGNE